jgi:hypothetical protein
MRTPPVTAVGAFMREPLGGDPTVRSAVAVASPVLG